MRSTKRTGEFDFSPHYYNHLGVVALVPVQVVLPYGIESVNGSDINMGCTSPLVDSDGVMVCMSVTKLSG